MKEIKFKLAIVVGTRPEIIRLSRIISLCDELFDLVLIHTGQNYDYELNQIFFEEMDVKKPDYFLNCDRSSVISAIGDIFIKIEPILKEEKPDAFLILGDTNSCLSAYVAKRMKIPIFHLEAGNRCFDSNVPEEINRKVIDHLADFNLVYSEHARRNLLNEGLTNREIFLIGSPLNEVIKYYEHKIFESKILNELCLIEKNYFVLSIHREENVDNVENLLKLVDSINGIHDFFSVPIVFSVHPRTLKKLNQLQIELPKNIIVHKPFGFFDYCKLQKNAKCVISDSGTISEESSLLNFPAISIRKSIERPESQDTASIILSGLEKDDVINSILLKIKLCEKNAVIIPSDYQHTNTSDRVVSLLVGCSKLNTYWKNIKN